MRNEEQRMYIEPPKSIFTAFAGAKVRFLSPPLFLYCKTVKEWKDLDPHHRFALLKNGNHRSTKWRWIDNKELYDIENDPNIGKPITSIPT